MAKEFKEFGRRKKKVCLMCTGKNTNYEDIYTLRKYISARTKIVPRRVTGNCARHQRHIAREIKRARAIGLLPFTK